MTLFLSWVFIFGQIYIIPQYEYLMPLDSPYCPGQEVNHCISQIKRQLVQKFLQDSDDQEFCESHEGTYKPWGAYYPDYYGRYVKSDCVYKNRNIKSRINISYTGRVPTKFSIK